MNYEYEKSMTFEKYEYIFWKIAPKMNKRNNHWDYKQSAYKCHETGSKVVGVKNFIAKLMKYLLRKFSIYLLFNCIQNPHSAVQRNLVYVFPWISWKWAN